MVALAKGYWPEFTWQNSPETAARHEARSLMLDCAKASALLDWKPVWNLEIAIKRTVDWYREYYKTGAVKSEKDLEQYAADAEGRGAVWTR
jgi:CDP-glucose 4,6-dehydratase